MRIALGVTMSALLLAWMQQMSAAEIIEGQIDNFENGTTQGWDSGSPNPTPPTNVPDGGPAGAGDNYLQITSNGGFGAGSRLVAFNLVQWTGDYLAAGVTEITADLKNLGSTALQIRLLVEGFGGSFVSKQGFSLPPSSGWQSASFPLGAGDLTGGANFSATLGHVTQLRIIHNPSASISPPPGIVAQLGVDNITAVPEPATTILLVSGGLALLIGAWRRQAIS